MTTSDRWAAPARVIRARGGQPPPVAESHGMAYPRPLLSPKRAGGTDPEPVVRGRGGERPLGTGAVPRRLQGRRQPPRAGRPPLRRAAAVPADPPAARPGGRP